MTAFRSKYGTFSYLVMQRPSNVSKTMDYIFQNMRQFAGAYIDDILVYTKTLAEHVPAIRQV